jgi:hypothetical protein
MPIPREPDSCTESNVREEVVSITSEALRQLLEGADFQTPAKVISRIAAKQACKVLPGLPYSIATNVAHADIWNRVWLNRLLGEPRFNPFPDFPPVPEKDWPDVRAKFLHHIVRAHELASADPFVHSCESDEAANKLLLRIAVHTSYHLGQIVLLKRALKGHR